MPAGTFAAGALEVSARYLGREQVLIEMPHGTMLADHPVRMGGDGRGPSAAELMLMAVSSSAVLTAGSARRDASVAPLTSRTGFRSVRERTDGPMTSRTKMAEINQRLEIVATGDPSIDEQLLAAAMASPVSVALTSGIVLTEFTEFLAAGDGAARHEFVNEAMLADDRAWGETEIGTRSVSAPEDTWRIGATSPEPGVSLVRHSHQTYVVGRRGDGASIGPSPEELLAASLAACSVFFIAHHCGFRSIPVASISARVLAKVDDRGIVTAIERSATVTGHLDDRQRADIDHIAGQCYVGLTMRSGVTITNETAIVPSSGRTSSSDRTGVDSLEVECDNGACCIPDLASPESRRDSAAVTSR